jgi:exonuclease SbcC
MEREDHAPPGSTAPPAGELIFENGNPAGARRALNALVTVIGRAAGCDIRLKGGDVQPIHCLLAHGPDGLQMRDFQTAEGTFVNGQRIGQSPLRDGDTLGVGGYLFRLSLAAPAASGGADDSNRDALRVQAAAVAAQQVALGEEENRLQQRLGALEQQEEQLSAHLEEKRRKLVQLGARAQAERAALQIERSAYEQYVKRIGGDVSDAQREMLEQQQQVQLERRRLRALRERLKKRWHRQFAAEQDRLAVRGQDLAREERNLKKESEAIKKERAALTHERLAFNSQYELGRRQIRDVWTDLRQERQQWRHRRGQERASLRLRARELDEQRLALVEVEQLLRNEGEAWEIRRQSLEKEHAGLNQRIRNQRDRILEQQLEINRLDAAVRAQRGQAAAQISAPAGQTPESAAAAPEQSAVGDEPASTSVPLGATVDKHRIVDLDRLAGELAEQRLQLAEQWQRLVRGQQRWEQQRAEAARELEAMVRPLQEQEQALTERERACCTLEEELRKKHRELIQTRHHLVGWRARLRACEATWEGERKQLLAEIRHREKLVDDHLKRLVDVRHRWARQRRQELEKLQTEQAACASLGREYLQLRQEWQRRSAALEEDKRIVAEKSLALEQFRREALTRSGNAPAAQRRVRRLRRRWLAQNAAALRAFSHERQALKSELTGLEARHEELHKLATAVVAAEMRLTEKQTNWERVQTESTARFARMEKDLNIALAKHECARQQFDKMKEEVEQIARGLLEEPDVAVVAVDKAA